MQKRLFSFLIFLFLVALAGCTGKEAIPAAPVGDHQTLEKLAEAYNSVSAQMDINPRQLPPSERKRFVEFVFRDAGYGYAETLAAMAGMNLDPADQNQRDLAELLLFPHRGGSLTSAVEDIYSDDEIAHVLAIEKVFN